jgi:hypothetical protein
MYFFSFFNQEYETSQIFPKFKTFGMKFRPLEQKLELCNQNMFKKFLKNNAHIPRQVILFEKSWMRKSGALILSTYCKLYVIDLLALNFE